MTSMDFGDPILGGTILRRSSIQSPNYVPGVSGWAINADGSAQFNNITVPPGTTGNSIYAQGTAPTAKAAGDLWINTASGNQISVWNGTAWVPYQWGTSAIASGAITTPLVAANAITTGQLAAGIVYAGIVDGTIVKAQTFIAQGTAGEYLGYSGAPAVGNLVFSISVIPTTDTPGNKVLSGETTYSGNQAVQQSAGAISFYTNINNQGGPGQPVPGQIVASGTYQGELIIAGGQAASTDGNPGIQIYAQSNTDPGRIYTNQSEIDFHAQQVYMDGALSLAAGHGPFVQGESFHGITMDSGWNTVANFAAPSYRLEPNNVLRLTGEAVWSSLATSSVNLNGSNPLPAAYRPVTSKIYRGPYASGSGARGAVQITSAGVISMLCTSTYTANYIDLEGTVALSV